MFFLFLKQQGNEKTKQEPDRFLRLKANCQAKWNFSLLSVTFLDCLQYEI